MAKKKKKDFNDGEFKNNPFGGLAGLSLPDADPALLASVADVPTLARLDTLSFRKEKKGRRGKTVTCISGSQNWPDEERASMMKKIKNHLGTGASFDGEHIVVQGDHIDRLKLFLENEKIFFKG